ncbi:glycosyltransferase, partial [Chromobacterium sp. ASV23]|uniref:glycosyltransferase n=1 Tax=Chromobacterium sp. ASV23 TaxID=2795110 RepID=UPI0018EDEE0D
ISSKIRENHQLAIVCSINSTHRVRLNTRATAHGIAENEIILTGFVSEEDLVGLYNLCKTFIFPSWHEGFGLPALEAMSCGKSVIASNITSLPEVVGHKDALFDPHCDKSISEKLAQVLTDDAFRAALESHGII